MTHTHVLGFPRIGARRELKFAVEAFWRGEAGADHVEAVGRTLRERHWRLQQAAGLSCVAVGDFSFYDTMLDHSLMLGAVPPRFGFPASTLALGRYFELARGNAAQPAMEMTKWFDTNYHYLVPELGPETRFEGESGRLCAEVREAQALGLAVKPVLIGPVTYLRLAKCTVAGFDRLALLESLVAAYARTLRELRAMGVERVQFDEPALCTDLEPGWLAAYDRAYSVLKDTGVGILLATYFGSTAAYADRIARLPLAGLHIDAVRAPETLDLWRRILPGDWLLSAGVVDGRNVWRNDLRATLGRLRPLYDTLGERLWLAPSCSLLHVPVTLEGEDAIDREVRPWLAFATEKLGELSILAKGLESGDAAIAEALAASDAAVHARRASQRTANDIVRREAARVADTSVERSSSFATRAEKQRAALALPLLPTTTIGSFPQTPEIRRARAAYRRRDMKALDYLQRMRAEIATAVRRQEALGLDVLVHGEAERNDMVEFFAEHLWGCALTANGWVQSYGSRCVKPPIVYGDVFRPEPITVDTIAYAQSLTEKPVKGMLTGPVTLLQWSFVRDDEPRAAVAMQLALAVRDEVADLEKAGIRVVQIDEPALREGLPLKREDWPHYLEWAVRAFKLCASGVADETQIHTHMCYAEFGDILPAIAAMDADVITIETSRSNMALLEAFRDFRYPNGIGPGVYDIHSPRVPTAQDMLRMIGRAADVIPAERLWINPDCGLKTRNWDETEAALRNMVEAARLVRSRLERTP